MNENKSPNKLLLQAKKMEDSNNSMDAIIDISIIKCSQGLQPPSPGYVEQSADEESEPLSEDFDEDRNYSILHREYQRLMRRHSDEDKPPMDESESLGKILNVSGISLERPSRPGNEERKESVIRRFEEIIKMLNRFVEKQP